MLVAGPFDKGDAFITIHFGGVGREACDWTDMLLRMYSRWCERRGYKIETIAFQAGDEVGVRSVTLKIIGENAFRFLQCERGAHRLVRISPFDEAKKRHTSFASVAVTHEIDIAKGQAEINRQYGEKSNIGWGSQIRSYVFQPYQMVKDLRTGEKTSGIQDVMDGDLDPFIEAKLRGKKAGEGDVDDE